jgi:hypothetical protein
MEPPLATHHALHLGRSLVARDPIIGTIGFTSTSEAAASWFRTSFAFIR